MKNLLSSPEEFDTFYNALVRDYAGKWVLVVDNEVRFADQSPNVVYEEYLKIKDSRKCQMLLVDDGEASFYDFEFSCDQNSATKGYDD